MYTLQVYNVSLSSILSLGAMHDEYDNKCFKSDAYIMAPSAGVPVNTNPWKFSSCSTNEFTTYINSLNK